jgi:tetratricopeptide (TPR) repeat protein
VSARGAIVPAALAAGLLAASFSLARAADAARAPEARAARGLPPLGALNLLTVDLLWLRADALFEEGRWPEMLAVYDAAGRAEPRLSASWEFRGFHLAYNLASDAAAEEDRDRWVVEGVRVLADGLARNPSSNDLRSYLGFTLLERAGRWPTVAKRLRAARGRDPIEEAVELTGAAAAAEPDFPLFVVRWYAALRSRAMRDLAAAPPGKAFDAGDVRRAAEAIRALLPAAHPQGRPVLESYVADAGSLLRAAESTDPAERKRILDSLATDAPGGK